MSLVPCVSIKGTQNSQIHKQFLKAEQNPVWNNMAVHPLPGK